MDDVTKSALYKAPSPLPMEMAKGQTHLAAPGVTHRRASPSNAYRNVPFQALSTTRIYSTLSTTSKGSCKLVRTGGIVMLLTLRLIRPSGCNASRLSPRLYVEAIRLLHIASDQGRMQGTVAFGNKRTRRKALHEDRESCFVAKDDLPGGLSRGLGRCRRVHELS